MGRNVETEFLKYIEKSLKEKGVKEIIGEYIETPKNKVVKNFYLQQSGWKPISENSGSIASYKHLL